MAKKKLLAMTETPAPSPDAASSINKPAATTSKGDDGDDEEVAPKRKRGRPVGSGKKTAGESSAKKAKTGASGKAVKREAEQEDDDVVIDGETKAEDADAGAEMGMEASQATDGHGVADLVGAGATPGAGTGYEDRTNSTGDDDNEAMFA